MHTADNWVCLGIYSTPNVHISQLQISQLARQKSTQHRGMVTAVESSERYVN